MSKDKSYLTIIRVDGGYDVEEITKLSLERAQEICGGYVQVIRSFNKFEGQPCAGAGELEDMACGECKGLGEVER